jgi:hypothetical protein
MVFTDVRGKVRDMISDRRRDLGWGWRREWVCVSCGDVGPDGRWKNNSWAAAPQIEFSVCKLEDTNWQDDL